MLTFLIADETRSVARGKVKVESKAGVSRERGAAQEQIEGCVSCEKVMLLDQLAEK